MNITHDSDYLWHLSYFSSVAGPFTTLSKSGVAWWSDKLRGNYWLHLSAADPADPQVHILVNYAPTDADMFAIMGYCAYHGIQPHINEYYPEPEEAAA